MTALARARRHRLAPVLLMLLALLAVGGVYAVVAPPAAVAETYSADDVAAGQKLFQANCASCHGASAEGRDGVAPSLIGVGAAAVNFQVATGRMPMAAQAPQAPTKTPQFNAEQIKQLAGWVATLGPGPSVPTEDMVDPARGDAANGMLIFRTNCAMCHNAVGAGGALSNGKYAPSLFESTPTEIYEAMLTGPQSMPVFSDANITPEGKRDVIAYLMEQRTAQAGVGGANLGAVGPVSEGLWVWVVGMGALVAAAVWIGAKSS
ncbi:menaquinol-cytochrome c reductase cytochrome c1 subunit precursor [Salana multivorans]|uniref:Cytochrome bc1 complex cytochrome c subunit n=1 Tax=Salana multivorans TaxID=120377 RepID=A0A3N2D1P8_9MICO|nr:cytochrome c [Salana multivorans]MBN8881830.1 c-type cytochrome [Salana multivorans]OJX94470.1 MAG: cystathionine beta-lyase [Micrococcales bacterium 73-15]ROR93702.1 menaquinol-cytochrome c reductase cytochrome c1 subunit precursor [Salana multivorans]